MGSKGDHSGPVEFEMPEGRASGVSGSGEYSG